MAIADLVERSSTADSEASPDRTTNGDATSRPATPQRLRKSGLALSEERQALLEQFTEELTTIYQQRFRRSLVEMKRRYPKFELWNTLSEVEQKELFDQEFVPNHLAKQLVMRRYGITSEETLKKDRRKLKTARKR